MPRNDRTLVRTPEDRAALAQDAENRSWRTLLVGLAVDVLLSVALVLLTYFQDRDGWDEVEWGVLGFLLLKSALMAGGAYVLRRFLDPSRIPTPLPPTPQPAPADPTP